MGNDHRGQPREARRHPYPPKNDLAALGLISLQPMHGYALRQKIHRMGIEHWTNISTSSIYSALRRLARVGAVSITHARQGRAPERTVYHITPRGRALLAVYLAQALSSVGPQDRLFYLGLAFAHGLPISEAVAHLELRVARLSEAIGQHEREERQMQSHDPPIEHAALMISAGRHHLRIERQVCRRLLDLFRTTPDYFRKLGGLVHDW